MKRDLPLESEVQRHFRALADVTQFHVNGLVGLSIYIDSQFIQEWQRAGFPDPLKSMAHAIYKRAIHERVVGKFPNHRLTRFSRDYLANHEC